ncbi:hypothetical protein PMIN06_009519 [Paraphaeosphaeria minitans]
MQYVRDNARSDTTSGRACLSKLQLRRRRFLCPHKPCDKVFASNNDLARHLATRKHRRESGSDRVNKFRCTVPWCKRNSEGFMRKDHWTRHVEKMHPGLARGESEGRHTE